MWRLCGVIIKIHFSDPQLNFGSVLEIHFLFIFEIQNLPYSHIVKITRSYGQNHPSVKTVRKALDGKKNGPNYGYLDLKSSTKSDISLIFQLFKINRSG